MNKKTIFYQGEKMKKFKPKNRHELLELVKNNSIYLGDICTSAITDMGNLFLRAKRKNFSGIEYWDTSNVITMEGMFAECKHFDIPIGCWDVSKVKDMSFMFYGCATFNQPLSFTPFLIKISFILYSSFLCKKALSR